MGVNRLSPLRLNTTLTELPRAGKKILDEAELRAYGVGQPWGSPLIGAPLDPDGSVLDPLDAFRNQLIDYTFCVPADPLKTWQKSVACQRIELLRSCRNILGFGDDLVPPLRFEALHRLTVSFGQLAEAAERDMLNFRQQFEQATFSLLDARNQLVLSEAEDALQALNVLQAEGDVRIAELQLDQVGASAEHFEQLLSVVLVGAEHLALDAANAAAAFSVMAAIPALAGIGLAIGGVAAAPATGGAGTALAGATTIATALTGGLSSVASAASTVSSAAAMQAGFERRAQEWVFDLSQARFSTAIAQQTSPKTRYATVRPSRCSRSRCCARTLPRPPCST